MRLIVLCHRQQDSGQCPVFCMPSPFRLKASERGGVWLLRATAWRAHKASLKGRIITSMSVSESQRVGKKNWVPVFTALVCAANGGVSNLLSSRVVWSSLHP